MISAEPPAFSRQTILEIAEAIEEAQWQRFRTSGESLASNEIADLIERGLTAERAALAVSSAGRR